MTLHIQPGRMLLGKYCVERVLGQGGMGVVVAARHIDLGELFAIKFLLPAALAYPDAVERFLREARAAARLKGEHVVKVQDVGRLPDGMPYMVMEHLSGSDLKDVVRQHGPLSVVDAIHHVLQACEALAEAHAFGIVHRDLKPANLFLIRRPNGTPCVKVLDFGISKQVEPETAEQHALTHTGVVLGSPAYMSPEQIMRTKEADPRGDIWSMGVVLYQLLAGTLPFRSDALTELIGKVLQEEPLPPRHHRPDIPRAVEAVVMTCLQKRREHRYQTVEQLMTALRASLTTNTVPQEAFIATQGAPRPSLPSVPAQPELKGGTVGLPGSRGPSAGLAAGASPGLGGQTSQGWGTTAVLCQPSLAPGRTGVLIGAAVALLVLVGVGAVAVWQYGDESGTTAATLAPDPGPITTAAEATRATSGTPSSAPTGAPAPDASDAARAPADAASASPAPRAAVSTPPAATTANPTTATPTAPIPTAIATPATTAKPATAPRRTAPAAAPSLLGRD